LKIIQLNRNDIARQIPHSTDKEREILYYFLKEIRKGPLERSELEDLFCKISFAVPKTYKIKKIYKYTPNLKLSQGIQNFKDLSPSLQIYFAHICTLVLFMWAHYQGDSPEIYLYKSDVINYAFKKKSKVTEQEDEIAYSEMEILMKLIGNLPNWTISNLDKEKCLKCWEQGVAGKHFLPRPSPSHNSSSYTTYTESSESSSESDEAYPVASRQSNYREAKKKQVNQIPNGKIQRCGVRPLATSTTTVEYLDEILVKLNLLCKFQGLL
jgi:hypothetical protein